MESKTGFASAIAVFAAITALSTGCAARYPRPANPNYVEVKGLWYCVGNVVFPWGPGGATWVDDWCRPNPCGDMKFPEIECLSFGKAIE